MNKKIFSIIQCLKIAGKTVMTEYYKVLAIQYYLKINFGFSSINLLKHNF